MKTITKILLAMIFVFYNCNRKNIIKKSITINLSQGKESYFFISKDTLKFRRNIKILENTLSDTIILGNSILAPKQIGNFQYTKLGNRNDVILDLKYSNPPEDRILVKPYKNRLSKGKITFEFIIMQP